MYRSAERTAGVEWVNYGIATEAHKTVPIVCHVQKVSSERAQQLPGHECGRMHPTATDSLQNPRTYSAWRALIKSAVFSAPA